MAVWEAFKTPLEKMVEARGKRAFLKGVNIGDISEYGPAAESIRTGGERQLEDVAANLPAYKMGGPANALLLEKIRSGTQGAQENLARDLVAARPEQYIGGGLQAGGEGFNRAMKLIENDQAREAMQSAEKMKKASIGNPCVSSSCMIFTEGWTRPLEEPVRRFRDEHYSDESYVAQGYKLMSQWLVPMILRSKFVRSLIRGLMLNPMSKCARYYYTSDRKWIIYSPIALFWTIFWDMTARLRKAVR